MKYILERTIMKYYNKYMVNAANKEYEKLKGKICEICAVKLDRSEIKICSLCEEKYKNE